MDVQCSWELKYEVLNKDMKNGDWKFTGGAN